LLHADKSRRQARQLGRKAAEVAFPANFCIRFTVEVNPMSFAANVDVTSALGFIGLVSTYQGGQT
jgi:hypothetical protein